MTLPAAGLWVLALLAGPAPGAVPEGSKPTDPVARAREMLSKETGTLDRIDALDRLISQLALQQFELGEKLAAQEARLKALTENHGVVSEQITRRRTLVQMRLRARGRLDEAAYVRILLGAHDPTEVVHRRVYLRRVLENDARLLRDLRQAEETLKRLGAEQAQIIAAIEQNRGALTRQRTQLETERRTRTAMLESLRQSRDALRRLALEQGAARDHLVFEGAAAPGARGFAAERGRLPLPAPGTIVRGYGRAEDVELGTAIFRKGVEIDALLGTPVRAVYAGQVAYAGWYKGFGNLVIVSHGEDFHTLYAHLASISHAVGDTVPAGEALGAVGDTGSLRGPVLYFEIREKKRSLDPAEWLVRRR